jgi:hypothetical protein
LIKQSRGASSNSLRAMQDDLGDWFDPTHTTKTLLALPPACQ